MKTDHLSWPFTQLETWRDHRILSPDHLTHALNKKRYIYQVKNGNVQCSLGEPSIYAERANCYLSFFAEIASIYHLPDMTFLLDVGDEAVENRDIPVFTFQRLIGTKNILLPDINFLENNFYVDGNRWGLPDNSDYLSKQNTAAFFGSTTGGGHIRVDTMYSVPRIAAASYFIKHASVDFYLSNVVQCDVEVKTALSRAGILADFTLWPFQLRNKFLISMDGNGAACSRVFVALASDCVLLKYASDFELFYFSALSSGRHYIDIPNHETVLNIIEQEIANPGLFKVLAEESRAFAASYLNKKALQDYTYLLLRLYAELA